jgi:hypothetical protein
MAVPFFFQPMKFMADIITRDAQKASSFFCAVSCLLPYPSSYLLWLIDGNFSRGQDTETT